MVAPRSATLSVIGEEDSAKRRQILDGGFSFLVRQNGMIVISQVGGYSRMPYRNEGAGMRWTATKPMMVASVSKTITAASIMKLWEEKRAGFSLDAPFWPYMKDLFPSATQLSQQITIRQLLTHRSGLTASGGDNISEVVKVLACSTNKLPGKTGQYNNVNFYLLRLVLEHLSSEPYTQYVRNHLSIPAGALGMNTKPEAQLPMLSYQSKNANVFGHPFNDFAASAGAVGWYVSASDLTAFSYGISNGRVLSKSTRGENDARRIWLLCF